MELVDSRPVSSVTISTSLPASSSSSSSSSTSPAAFPGATEQKLPLPLLLAVFDIARTSKDLLFSPFPFHREPVFHSKTVLKEEDEEDSSEEMYSIYICMLCLYIFVQKRFDEKP